MKRKYPALFFFVLLLTSYAVAAEQKEIFFDEYLKKFNNEERGYMKIRIPELAQLFKQNQVQIIDIRTPEEYRAFRLDFMTHIPINELPDRLGELDKDRIIVTVCANYDRAMMVRIWLTLKGYRSRYLVDGMIGLAGYFRSGYGKEFVR